jgi:glycosyltransferase involved in cell wall biosynthesis
VDRTIAAFAGTLDGEAAMTAVILDISRLISRVRYATPSGIDRVEMAYARGLLTIYGEALAFAAVHPSGLYGRIRRDVALAYLDELETRWAQDSGTVAKRPVLSVLPWMMRLIPVAPRAPVGNRWPVYVQVSPHHLVNGAKVRRILQQEQARFVCMVHDLIPIEFPEYARPGGDALHRRRMETVLSCADSIIVNSQATGHSLQRLMGESGRQVPIHVALLGTEPPRPVPPSVQAGTSHPYFICLGTIEGRKNHLLLLHLWRQFADTMPTASIPRLVIVGRRGWENEQVLDLLDRCPSLAGIVEEIGCCSDDRLASLMHGARALLMPSFAEGFGMPIAEALAIGLPVICSDIPAHREVGLSAPDYLHPLDGPAWATAILDYAASGPAAARQRERMGSWSMPTWAGHMAIVRQAISELA